MIDQLSLNAPSYGGSKLTSLTTTWPGGMTVPGAIGSLSVKPGPDGGTDAVTVRLVPPPLLTMTSVVAGVPSLTTPRSTDDGEMTSCGDPAPVAAVRGTDANPWSVVTPNQSWLVPMVDGGS